MAAIEETPHASVNRSNSRLRWLSWIPAASPLVLLVVFVGTLLWNWPHAGGGVRPGFCMLAMQGLFIFAFYLAVPLWCVLAVYPALRPTPAGFLWQIVSFGGAWLAFFIGAQSAPELCQLFIGVN